MKPLNTMVARTCAVCGGQRKEVLFRQDFGVLSSGSLLRGYDVVRCLDCGFCFADGIPGQDKFDAYYAEMSKYEYQESGGRETSYDLGRFRQLVSIMQPFIPSAQARILEIGCATGRLLALLKEQGFPNVFGVDPSPFCAAAAARLYGLTVQAAKISDMRLAAGAWDFIVMSGVLEHLRDLHGAIPQVTRLLAPGGHLYICVPDASRFATGEDAPYQEFSVEHVNYFGPLSLANLMRTHGLMEVACRQTMMLVNYRTRTPALHGIFCAGNVADKMVPDLETAAGLSAYLAVSRCADEHILRTVAELADAGLPVIVWGAGSHTLRLMQTSKLSAARIAAFVDSNPHYQGKQLNGIPILSPAELRGRHEPILISSRVYQEAIQQQIRHDLKLPNRLILLYQPQGSTEVLA